MLHLEVERAVVKTGEKLHIIIRRRFESDIRRHFLGKVETANDYVAKVTGYVFVLDNTTGKFARRDKKRTRIIGLADAGNIINLLPDDVDINKCKYTQSANGKLIVTDDKNFHLDINEFGSSR